MEPTQRNTVLQRRKKRNNNRSYRVGASINSLIISFASSLSITAATGSLTSTRSPSVGFSSTDAPLTSKLHSSEAKVVWKCCRGIGAFASLCYMKYVSVYKLLTDADLFVLRVAFRGRFEPTLTFLAVPKSHKASSIRLIISASSRSLFFASKNSSRCFRFVSRIARIRS